MVPRGGIGRVRLRHRHEDFQVTPVAFEYCILRVNITLLHTTVLYIIFARWNRLPTFNRPCMTIPDRY